MRDTTQLLKILLEIVEVSTEPEVDQLALEGVKVAKRMDARTGTVDPSQRPGFHSGRSGTARRRTR